MQTYLLHQHGKIGNISKDFTRHADIATTMNVYTHLKSEDTKDELEQMKSKGAVKKGDDFGGHGVCQKGNKESE